MFGVLVERWLFLLFLILQQAAMNSYPNCCHQLKHRQPLSQDNTSPAPLPLSRADRLAFLAQASSDAGRREAARGSPGLYG